MIDIIKFLEIYDWQYIILNLNIQVLYFSHIWNWLVFLINIFFLFIILYSYNFHTIFFPFRIYWLLWWDDQCCFFNFWGVYEYFLSNIKILNIKGHIPDLHCSSLSVHRFTGQNPCQLDKNWPATLHLLHWLLCVSYSLCVTQISFVSLLKTPAL